MTQISIRQIQNQEMLDVLYSLTQYSLHPSPPFENKEEWDENVRGRKGVTCFATFENEKPVSVAVSTAMTQNIRGKLYPAAGVWGVSTDPVGRRKGYCRKTIASLLEEDRKAGAVFSNLYPFRESFYERMGYVAFPLTKIAKFSPASISSTLKMELDGEIELKLIGEAYETYREYLSNMRNSQHGMALFDEGALSPANRNRLWIAIARFNGNIEGLMLYRLIGEEVTKYNFRAIRFYYQTSQAKYLLLNWIARHVDQANRVELWLAENEYPELWISDIDVTVESAVRPAMSRVLDVEKIGVMNTGNGSFAAKIIDTICPWNEGVWQFECINGYLHVSKATLADCELSIQGLSALVTGTRDPQDFHILGWGNPNSDLQSIMREMFPAARPFLHENF